MQDLIKLNRDIFDMANEENNLYKAPEGLSEGLIRQISKDKNEPEWMLNKRLRALELFNQTPLPNWGPDLSKLDLSKISFYVRPDSVKNSRSWDEVPQDIKKTFERLGIPEAEREALAGAGAQYDSNVVYHNLKKEWDDKGVIFEDCDVALQKYPKLMKEYFMNKCIPINDHKFIMLHASVWSGGTFIYVPKNVRVDIPLQAYFRMNSKKMGQFEHTLIIADEGSEVSYIEGCSSPVYNPDSIHAGCVEIYVKKNARVRYSSIENWSKNTYNLNTKRAIVEENGIIEWISGNMGSGVTMLYPSSILKGRNSKADHISIAFAGKGQNQDTGAKVFHLNVNTSSNIQSKSISIDGGTTSYRGLVKINKGCKGSRSSVECDALMIDNKSISNTYPFIDVKEKNVDVAHEATVGKISDEQIFYLMSRGLNEEQAKQIVVSGFIEPIIKQLPLENAAELNKLIELEMEGSLG